MGGAGLVSARLHEPCRSGALGMTRGDAKDGPGAAREPLREVLRVAVGALGPGPAGSSCFGMRHPGMSVTYAAMHLSPSARAAATR